MKILINPKYEYLRPFVEKLTRPIFFTRHGTTLHDGRNRIKLFEADRVKLVVKSYERLPLFNRFVYGSLRNMHRLSCRTPAYLYILHRYAELLHTNTDGVQLKGVVCRLVFEWKQRTERKIKSIFRRNKAAR